MSGRKSRRKGKTGELELVAYARNMGLAATRIPLSGASEGFKGDIIIEGRVYGVKRWKRALNNKIKEDLVKFRGCFIREDRQDWWVILPAEDYFKLLQRVKGG
jgi:Holliday junction resolvase